MIERRGEKQQYHAAAIEAVAGDSDSVSARFGRLRQQQHQTDNAEQAAETVADAVSDLLSERVALKGQAIFHDGTFLNVVMSADFLTSSIARNILRVHVYAKINL